MKLKETLKLLITERASIESVYDAIQNRQTIIMYYAGDKPGGEGLREIEPVALGRSKSGNLVVRAWDKEGASHRGYLGKKPLPGWRLFRLDKILAFKPTGEVYNEPRPNYNFSGDKSMKSILTIANFQDIA
jgi:predicted DNA-binding transcriptional regulator YafY